MSLQPIRTLDFLSSLGLSGALALLVPLIYPLCENFNGLNNVLTKLLLMITSVITG